MPFTVGATAARVIFLDFTNFWVELLSREDAAAAAAVFVC
jgi:hypothetical protein